MIKFSINKQAFLKSLGITKQAIGSKIAIPVLSKMKITVSDKGILLTASNGQISIENLLPRDDKNAGMLIESEGSILLEANFFDSVIRQLPEVTFEFEEIENNQVLITSGKLEMTLKGQAAELYPQIQQISSKSSAKISVGQLKEIFDETSFAASTQESRPILTGVHLMLIDHQNLIAVSTDSHRLSQRIIHIENFGEDFDVVIPNRTIAGFKNVFSEDDDTVNIYLSGTQLLVKNETINFYTRLLEGMFPDTNRLIPEESLYSLDLTFDVADLRHAMDRAKLMTSSTQNGTVKLTIEEDKIVSSVNSPEVGSSFEELSVLEKAGEPLEISFNPQFMIDALKVIKEPKVRIQFISNIRPFTLMPKEEGQNFVQLITPVRTN